MPRFLLGVLRQRHKANREVIACLLLRAKALLLSATIAAMLPSSSFAQAKTFTSGANDSLAISSGRPLSEVSRLLESRFGTPVTYEDPVLWIWSGDISPGENGWRGMIPKIRTLTLSAKLNPLLNKNLDFLLLGKIVDAYNGQTDGTRFRVSSSRWGLHIAPIQAHNSSGQLVTIKPIMDYRITIPVASRVPYMHFRTICEALTKSSGISIKEAAPWMDQYFAPNGLIPPRAREMTPKEENQASITWGCKGMTAREAINSMIENSATTLTWHLLCSADPKEQDCRLNLHPIQIMVGDPNATMIRSIPWDRSKDRPTYIPEN